MTSSHGLAPWACASWAGKWGHGLPLRNTQVGRAGLKSGVATFKIGQLISHQALPRLSLVTMPSH